MSERRGSHTTDAGEGQSTKRKQSQADQLLALVQENYELGINTEGAPFAVPTSGPRIARDLRGSTGSLRAELAAAFMERHGKVPTSSALADAMLAVEGFARQQPPEELYLRSARVDDALWIDLGNADGEVIRVDHSGWIVQQTAPVLFRRTALTGRLPLPAADGGDDHHRGGDHLGGVDDHHGADGADGDIPAISARAGGVEALAQIIGFDTSSDNWLLLLGWMVSALREDIPRPALALTGEQGSAKTTVARLLVGLLDPSPAAVRSAPKEERDWHVCVAGSTIVALDNLRGVAPWLSDLICRAVTGDAYPRRKLYTDGEIVVDAYKRSIILTGIDLGGLRGDLLDRTILLEMPRIPDHRRRPEAEIMAEYRAAKASIFAGLLDLVALTFRHSGAEANESLPRMADHARVLTALDAATGLTTLDAYRRNATGSLAQAVEADHVARAVGGLLDEVGQWSGIISELLAALDSRCEGSRPTRGWPTTPQHLAARLRGAAPSLRAAGYDIDDRYDAGGRRVWNLGAPRSDGNHRQHRQSDGHQTNAPQTDGVDGVGRAPLHEPVDPQWETEL